jgi:hypothetical protein
MRWVMAAVPRDLGALLAQFVELLERVGAGAQHVGLTLQYHPTPSPVVASIAPDPQFGHSSHSAQAGSNRVAG